MKYYLAPMEGVTTYVFRNAYHNTFYPADKYFTPFLVPHVNKKFSEKEWNELNPENNREMYVVPQILTCQAEDFVRTAKVLREYGYQEVNLNLGCPSKTVVSKGRGSGFLENPRKLDAFFAEVFEKLDMDVSVKTRIGLESPLEFEDILAVYEKYPVKELIIHPRVQTDYYKNHPNLEVFRKAVETSRHSICYNGDLFSEEDVGQFSQKFPKVEKLMLGRGVVAYPDLLQRLQSGDEERGNMCTGLQASEADQKNRYAGAQSGGENRKELLQKFHQELLDGYCAIQFGERNVLFKMKEFWSYFVKNFEDEKKLWKKIKKCEKLSVYESIVADAFAQSELKK